MKTIERYLRGTHPVREVTKRRIQTAMTTLGLGEHIPKAEEDRAPPLALVRTR